MGREKHADYIRKVRRLYPDLAITCVREISDGFTCVVLVVNDERIFRFVTNQDHSWVAEGYPEQARILRLLPDYVSIPVPLYDVVDADCVSYWRLPGRGLIAWIFYVCPSAIRRRLQRRWLVSCAICAASQWLFCRGTA